MAKTKTLQDLFHDTLKVSNKAARAKAQWQKG
jgi:hypothetical protein